MFSRIEILPETKLTGLQKIMKLSDNMTFALWSSFMPRLKEIPNRQGNDLFSMQVYDPAQDFLKFNENTPFTKWAATPVTGFGGVPQGLETYIIKGGLYAVFIHKGLPQSFPATMGYIFGAWLPNSGYALDNREHFEILGTRYRRDDPESEEEVWIPVMENTAGENSAFSMK